MSDHVCIKSTEIDKMMEWIVGTGLTYTGLKIFKKKKVNFYGTTLIIKF
mgnify:CR=1 FL=1